MTDITRIGIDRCLSCTKPECDNCLRYYNATSKRGRKSTYNPKLIAATLGLTQKKAALVLNVSVTTIKRQRSFYYATQQTQVI